MPPRKIRLRPPRWSDMPFIRWLWADPETMEPVGGPVHLTDEQAQSWFAAMVDPGSPADCYRLIFDSEDRPVGEISYHRLDSKTMVADFNLKIVASQRKKGYGREAMRVFLDDFFNKLGGALMTDDVALDNRAGQQALLDFGFEHDPAAKGVFRLQLTREQFRQRYFPQMSAADLVELLRLLEESALEAWLDGGWGVDALLGRQTRPHRDVDLILRVSDVPRLQELLGRHGFAFKEGSPPHSFVLADGRGLEVDIHAVRFDQDGNGTYRMQNGQDWIFPAEGFSGRGTVANTTVRCLSPEVQVHCHAHGYTPVEKDFRDMELLQQAFGLELPAVLRRGS